jgi:hypothetical protein
MVGGVVIGISRKDGLAHVHVADCPHYPKCGRGDKCKRPDTSCVYTDEIRQDNGQRVEIGLGDSFWWQCGSCMWTPAANRNRPDVRSGVDYDIRLNKIGYSH